VIAVASSVSHRQGDEHTEHHRKQQNRRQDPDDAMRGNQKQGHAADHDVREHEYADGFARVTIPSTGLVGCIRSDGPGRLSAVHAGEVPPVEPERDGVG